MNPRSCGVAASLFFLLACASGPSVRPQLTQTTGAVRAADEVGAQQLPDASLHLKLAKENVARGERAVEDGEEELARRLLERAEIDAELAIALVKENRARQDVELVNKELAELRSRLEQQ